ncbi:MAG: hypothetical protein ABI353_18165 [Isosphaeraceae bacterium]
MAKFKHHGKRPSDRRRPLGPRDSGAKCVRCGGTFRVDLPALAFPFTAVIAVCPECAAADLLADGGHVVSIAPSIIAGSRFDPGALRVTPGAAAALADSKEHSATFLSRHNQGDWGHIDETDVEDEDEDEDEDEPLDSELNAEVLASGRGQIMSAYRTAKGVEIWLVSHLGDNNQTTILLPEEY